MKKKAPMFGGKQASPFGKKATGTAPLLPFTAKKKAAKKRGK